MRSMPPQAAHKPFPEVHIRGDKDVRFEAIGRVILACQQAGILKVGFLTEPQRFENSNANAAHRCCEAVSFIKR